MKVAVVGATGFIGRSVVRALNRRGHDVVPVSAPRLRHAATDLPSLLLHAADVETQYRFPGLVTQMQGADALINAAGVAEATGTDLSLLIGANALLPAVLQRVVRELGIGRLVHVSSAAVQGRRKQLDESTDVAPFSGYSLSKALGEAVLLQAGDMTTHVFRPTSVHGPNRRVTQRLVRVASSPLAAVAGDGSSPTPQVLAVNVGDAIAHVSTCEEVPPPILLQPSEGLTVGSLLWVLGNREPRHLPANVAGALVAGAYRVSRVLRRAEGQARRLEMILFGQAQAATWLESVGWRPVEGKDAWTRLRAGALQAQSSTS